MPGLTPRGIPSKITIPAKAHPFARLVFAEMAAQGVTYEELEWRSNVLISTFKAWRADNRPGLETIQAALGSLGWELVPVPRMDRLPKDIQAALEALAETWKREEPLLHQLLATCCLAPILPTKRRDDRARLGQCLPSIAAILREGFDMRLAEPIEINGKRVGLVTIHAPKVKTCDVGDFKGAIGFPSIADLTGLSEEDAKRVCAADAAVILAAGKAAMAIVGAVPALASATQTPRTRAEHALKLVA